MQGRLLAIGVTVCTIGLPIGALANIPVGATWGRTLLASPAAPGAEVSFESGGSAVLRTLSPSGGDVAFGSYARNLGAPYPSWSGSVAPTAYLAQLGQQGGNSKGDPSIISDSLGNIGSIDNGVDNKADVNQSPDFKRFPILRILYYILHKHFPCVSPSRPHPWCD
jgi:hypothetical protein